MSGELISEIEAQLPPNTKEAPQPTVFRVTAADLAPHRKYIQTFPLNKNVQVPQIKPFVNKEKLNEAKDEYLYTSTDPKGETKITKNGHLLGGRKFTVTTFTLPGHGKKLYVLAAEAAKVTGYRDAFIMFGRFKNLLRYPTGEEYRPFFIENNLYISKVKSRPVGLVTAKSLFMFFGARVIQGGRRVIDDYWEEQVLEQGFTEEDQVFPVDRKHKPPKSKAEAKLSKTKQQSLNQLYVTPAPLLEDRIEYLKNQSNGVVTQVLPGQGISGGLELSSIATIPKYTNESSAVVKHKNILNSLSTSSSTTPTVSTHTATVNQLAIDDELAGKKTNTGLPYYNKSITKRIRMEEPEKLKEIEYLHGLVETNFIVSSARIARNKVWNNYWQVKSGTPIGLTKENALTEIKNRNEEILNKVEEEKIYNEYLNCEQIITKRRKPNPNFLGYGNIKGLKPPYAEKPDTQSSNPSSSTSMTTGAAISSSSPFGL